MKILLTLLTCLSCFGQAATLNYVSSNTFNAFVDTRVRKPANAPSVGAFVTISPSSATNHQYTTLVGTNGVSVTPSGTNTLVQFTGSVPGTVIAVGPAVSNALVYNVDSSGTNLASSAILKSGTTTVFPGNITIDSLAASNAITSLTLNSGTVNGTNLQVNGLPVIGGTYTPNYVDITNAASISAFICQYQRVGSIVTVSGHVNVDPINNAATKFSCSFPVASNISAVGQVGGTAATDTLIPSEVASISGDITGDYAVFQWNTAQVAAQNLWFTFTYLIN